MMFALRSSPNHIQIKSRGQIKKTSHLRPIYLTLVSSLAPMLKLDSLAILSLEKKENKRSKCIKTTDPHLDKKYVYHDDMAQVKRSPHEEL